MPTAPVRQPRTQADRSAVPGDKTYPIRTVAKLTGLTPDLIRAWERRYAVVEPVRGPRGARLYGEADVDRLRTLARVVGNGRSIGDVAHLPPEQLARIVEAPAAPRLATEWSAEAPIAAPAAAPSVATLLAAVDAIDMAALERGLSGALLALGAPRFAREVAIPLLDAVGAAWAQGRLSIGQEHLVSNAMRNLLGALARSGREPSAPSILLAGPSGERHEFGLLMVAVLAADRGLGTYVLGVDVPAADIAATARKLRVGAVGLSLVAEGNRVTSARALADLEAGLPEGIEIWLGGGDAHNVLAMVPPGRAQLLQSIDQLDRQLERFLSGTALR